jgi:hypothetical protein
MHKGVLMVAVAAALTLSALHRSSAMPTMATGALKAPASASSRVERAGYYYWGNYFQPEARYDYYRPYGYNGIYRPSYGYYSYYQTYGCSYFPDQYCTYNHWPPFFFPGFW